MIRDVSNRQQGMGTGVPKGPKTAMTRFGASSIPRNSSSLSRPVSDGGRATVTKDPRPLSERPWQKTSSDRIQQWLIAHGFDMQKTAKGIMNLSQSDFFSIVEFVYAKTWSPNFRLTNCGDPVEGTLSVFRTLKYPFPLSKSMLQSIAPHTIGNVIGMIMWLVELADNDEECGMGPTTTKRKGEDETVDQLWMNYLAESFKASTKPQVLAKLDECFKEKLRQQLSLIEEAAKDLERQSTELKQDLQEAEEGTAKAVETAAELERRITAISTDIPKYDQLIAQFGQRNAELEAALVAKQQEVAAAQAQLQVAAAEKASLEDQVAKQGFTPAERERVLTERASLQMHLQDTMSTKEQRSRDVSDAEIFVSRKIDEIERKIQAYQEILVRLSLLREEPRLAVSLAATSTPDVEEKLQSDLRKIVKPTLKEKAKSMEDESSKEAEEQVAKEDRLIRLRERVQELDCQYERLEAELRESEKRVSDFKEKCEAEARQQEALVAKVRSESAACKEQALQELNAARAEVVATTTRCDQEREQQRIERGIWEAKLMELNKALVEHRGAIHQELEEALAESRRLVELAQQQPAPQVPRSASKRVATPARPSKCPGQSKNDDKRFQSTKYKIETTLIIDKLEYRIVCRISGGPRTETVIGIQGQKRFLIKSEETGETTGTSLDGQLRAISISPTNLSRIPGPLTLSSIGNRRFLVVPIPGPLLSEVIQDAREKPLELPTVIHIGRSMVRLIHEFHSKGVICNGVSPKDFALTSDDPATADVLITGTSAANRELEDSEIDFAPRRAHEGDERFEIDDLESVTYVLLALLGRLPWSSLNDTEASEIRRDHVYRAKVCSNVDELIGHVPDDLIHFWSYSRSNEPALTPDYPFLERLLIHCTQAARSTV